MLRKTLFVLVVLVILFNQIAGLVPANVSVGVVPVIAQGPVPAKPVEIQVWTNLPVKAGSQLEITVVATTEAGPMADQPVVIAPDENHFLDTALNDTGGLSVTLGITTTAGSYVGTVAVGNYYEVTRSVAAGDSWGLWAAHSYSSYADQRTFMDTNRAEERPLRPAQVVTVTYGPATANFTYEVEAAEAVMVRWTSPLTVTAGQAPYFTGMAQDRYGNGASDQLTVIVGNESFSLAGPEIQVAASKVYTSAGYYPLVVERTADGRVLMDGPFGVVPAEPAKLTMSGPAEASAGSTVTITAELTDEFGNPNEAVEVTGPEEGITGTTDLDGAAIFTYAVPTITQLAELDFSAAGLASQHVLTVTPGAATEITAAVRDDGSVAAMVYDQYGNARPGDSVTVTLETATGQSVIVQTKTVAPPAEEAVAAPAVPPAVGQEYTVVKGDSLWKIWSARRQAGQTIMEWQSWKTQVMQDNSLSYTGNIVIIGISQVLVLNDMPV